MWGRVREKWMRMETAEAEAANPINQWRHQQPLQDWSEIQVFLFVYFLRITSKYFCKFLTWVIMTVVLKLKAVKAIR